MLLSPHAYPLGLPWRSPWVLQTVPTHAMHVTCFLTQTPARRALSGCRSHVVQGTKCSRRSPRRIPRSTNWPRRDRSWCINSPSSSPLGSTVGRYFYTILRGSIMGVSSSCPQWQLGHKWSFSSLFFLPFLPPPLCFLGSQPQLTTAPRSLGWDLFWRNPTTTGMEVSPVKTCVLISHHSPASLLPTQIHSTRVWGQNESYTVTNTFLLAGTAIF